MIYSISTNKWDRNKSKGVPQSYKEVSTTITEFKDYISNNYAYCNCFNHPNVEFTCKGIRTQSNFKESWMITLDCDDMAFPAMTFSEALQLTELAPNLVYTTASNGVDKHHTGKSNLYRYRVIYILDRPITDANMYSHMVASLRNELSEFDSNINNDKSDEDAAHFYAGALNTQFYGDEGTTSLDFLIDRYGLPTVSESIKNDTCVNKKRRKETTISNIDDAELESDLNSMKIKDIIDKYSGKYPTIEATPIEFPNDALWVYTPSNYLEIHRRWEKVINPTTMKECMVVHKHKDGEGRRRILLTNMMLRRCILPTISLSHLIVNGLYELYYYMVNTQDKITKKDVVGFAKTVFNKSSEDMQRFMEIYHTKYKQRKYKINTELCIELGVNPKDIVREVNNYNRRLNKKAKDEMIDMYYDYRLTQEENILQLAEYGVQVSRTYISRYFKNTQLIKNSQNVSHCIIEREESSYYTVCYKMTNFDESKKQQLIADCYDERLTDDENLTLLHNNGIRCSKSTLTRYKKSISQQSDDVKLTKKEKQIAIYYDNRLTDKENIELLENNGIKVSLPTLTRYKNKIKKSNMTKEKNTVEQLSTEEKKVSQKASKKPYVRPNCYIIDINVFKQKEILYNKYKKCLNY